VTPVRPRIRFLRYPTEGDYADVVRLVMAACGVGWLVMIVRLIG